MITSYLPNGIKQPSPHSIALGEEMLWLKQVIDTALCLYFKEASAYSSLAEIPLSNPKRFKEIHPMADWNLADRLFLFLSLAPLLQPSIFDLFHIRNTNTQQRFTEFGCVDEGSNLYPTLDTILFLVAANDVTLRQHFIKYFEQHFLITQGWLHLLGNRPNEPLNCKRIQANPQLTELMLLERKYKPEFSFSFPAQHLTTTQKWSELVLSASTATRVEEIKTWITSGKEMLKQYELSHKIKPGFRALFYGPPGTGKTFTAALLGKHTGVDVYRIDLSLIVSKYIGETEKNLTQIFQQAANKNWILFFDEADALFGVRTKVKDAHDRYANQEVSYLLQKVEEYDGVIILATNIKGNIDAAFARRFQSIIEFPMPDKDERLKLWGNILSTKTRLEPPIILENIAAQYELSGGNIINVVRQCSLQAMKDGSDEIKESQLLQSIALELEKEGRTI